MDLTYFAANKMETATNYIAVFIPGGHGAMLGLPENEDLAKLIYWSHNKDLCMLTICHLSQTRSTACYIQKTRLFHLQRVQNGCVSR